MVLLFHGANKDAWDGCGQTALQIAATYGEAAVVNLLLRLEADRSAASYARLPHHITEAASGCLHIPVVEVPLCSTVCCEYKDEISDGKRDAAKPQAPAETCKPPLLKEACEDQSVQGFTLEDGRCHKGGTHEAAKYGNLAELFEILQHGMDINSRCENGYTAIHRKAKCGDTSAVNWLLESGANVTVWGDWQQTTLHVAAAYGRQGVVMVLLFHGADKDAWDGCGQTALQIAATCGEAAVKYGGKKVYVADKVEDVTRQSPRKFDVAASGQGI
ncbi:ankyrin repeat-containing protein DDB_G0279043-like [Schistocerca americana]|uniref:ankyrin repeat-containing protein DDB_G0279043-like n=1 Tax=Schistocerca americana TaxID=7009 RepID=UPI001F4FA11D|nr:ankyrin repeat-containing protein DDB_G0279043-like [Schistocerca americana]